MGFLEGVGKVDGAESVVVVVVDRWLLPVLSEQHRGSTSDWCGGVGFCGGEPES